MSPIAVIGKYIIEAVFHKIRVPRKHPKTYGEIVFLKKKLADEGRTERVKLFVHKYLRV